ncbi:MAG TPA: hypothetical protein VF077_12385 [Nitrospiraceae bacterium]
MAEYIDPFEGGERLPSLSWKNLPVHSTFRLTVLERAKALQSVDFESQKPAFWDEEKTNPKMCAVLNVRVEEGPHSVGELRSIWAQIPSNLFVALRDAQKAAGAKFDEHGTLHLRFVGEQPHEKKGYNPIKQYAAKYTPPVQTQGPDPFLNGDAPAPAQRPVAPPAARPTTATPAPKW